jgi:hypothetical protein
VLLAVLLSVLPPLLLGVPAPPAGADERPHGVWPLQPSPAVVARFDPPDSTWGAGHRGVDLAGHPVAVVRTALPGTVRFTGTIAGRGVVVVGHGDTRTTYEPVRATVSVGDVVAAGQPVGLLEVGGSHCFPAACLHWGWLRGETYLDPLLLVGAVPVRLLPPGGASPPGGTRPGSLLPGSLHLGGLPLGGLRPGGLWLGDRSATVPGPAGTRPDGEPAPHGEPRGLAPVPLGPPTIPSAIGPARHRPARADIADGATTGARLGGRR